MILNDKKIWFNQLKRAERERLFNLYFKELCYCQLNNTHIEFIYDKQHEVK